MKKFKIILKNNSRIIIGIIIGLMLCTGVYAATIYYNGVNVGYTSTGTNVSATDVQGALDELYNGFHTVTLDLNGDSDKVFWYDDDNNYSISVRTGFYMPQIYDAYGEAPSWSTDWTPGYANYRFEGFFDAVSGGTKYYDGKIMPVRKYDKSTDVTLYAHWTRQYMLNFHLNGGSAPSYDSGRLVVYGEPIGGFWSDPFPPTRAGYEFMGFYDNADYTQGTQYINVLGEDVRNWDKNSDGTIYAGWKPIAYTLTVNKGTNIDSCSVKINGTAKNCSSGCTVYYGDQYQIGCAKKSTSAYQYTNSDNYGSKRYKWSYAAPTGFTCNGTSCTKSGTITADTSYTVSSTASKTSCALRDSNIGLFSYANFKGCSTTGSGSGCNLDSAGWKTNGSYCSWSNYLGNGPEIPIYDGSGNKNAFYFKVNVSGGYASVFIMSNDPQLLAYNYQFDYGLTLYEGGNVTGTIGPIPGRLNGTGSAGSVANAFVGPYLRWVEGTSYCP